MELILIVSSSISFLVLTFITPLQTNCVIVFRVPHQTLRRHSSYLKLLSLHPLSHTRTRSIRSNFSQASYCFTPEPISFPFFSIALIPPAYQTNLHRHSQYQIPVFKLRSTLCTKLKYENSSITRSAACEDAHVSVRPARRDVTWNP